MEELKLEKIREEFGYSGKTKQWKIGFDALLKHLKGYTRPVSDSDIVWEGECPECEGEGISSTGNYICSVCFGRKTITRPATLDEWNEISMKAFKDVYNLQKQAGIQGFEVNKKYTINGGILKIKEDNDGKR